MIRRFIADAITLAALGVGFWHIYLYSWAIWG
jgi:hypothetical protein